VSAHRSLTTAQLLVQCLENEGVEYVFGIPGEENIRLVDAMKDSHIRFIRPSESDAVTSGNVMLKTVR
jgi:thiamine pyrophosphate-dependent acetolactate synthase large subunit-like protein